METISSSRPIARGPDLAELFSDLVRVETELWNELDGRLLEAHDLSLTWFEPMQVIDSAARTRVVDIAAALRITVGGASKLVERIEAAGLIVRSADPADGRATSLTLTAAGRGRLRAAESSHRESLRELLGSQLPPPRLRELARSLEALRSQPRPRGGSS